jgi:hypothetical protein
MAATAASCRWKESIDGHRLLALPQRLVLELSDQFADSSIAEALAQLGFRKGGERKILNDDDVVLSDDLGSELVEEVLAAISDSAVLARERLPCAFTSMTAGLGSRVPALCADDRSGGSASELGRCDPHAGVAHHEVDKSYVDSYDGRVVVLRLGRLEPLIDRNEPAPIWSSRDRCAAEVRAGITRDAGSDPADAREVDPALRDTHMLRNPKARLRSLLPAKPRIAGTTVEERLEGPL